jgi:hypothetical protein
MLADTGFETAHTENNETVECSTTLTPEWSRGKKRPLSSDAASKDFERHIASELDMMPATPTNIKEYDDVGAKRLKIDDSESTVCEGVERLMGASEQHQAAPKTTAASAFVDLTNGKRAFDILTNIG